MVITWFAAVSWFRLIDIVGTSPVHVLLSHNMQQQQSVYPVQKVASTNNDVQQQQSIYPVQRETSTINDKQQQQNIYQVQRTASTNFKIFQFVFSSKSSEPFTSWNRFRNNAS